MIRVIVFLLKTFGYGFTITRESKNGTFVLWTDNLETDFLRGTIT